jgi:hypothetical protein
MFHFIDNINNRKRPQGRYVKPNNLKRGIPPQPISSSRTVSLFSQPYLDTYNQCYKNIVVVNLKPQGPLGDLVRLIKFPPLSEFKQPGPCSPLRDCGYALTSLGGCSGISCHCDLMVVDEVPTLISFLVNNGYTIDTSITKMFNNSDIRFDTYSGNKLICFVTYNG